MRSGPIVLAVMAAGWAIGGAIVAGWAVWSWIVPVLGSLAIGAWCWRRLGDAPRRSAGEARRIRRLVGLCSFIEGALIVLAGAILPALGADRAMVPVIALIVGLHFVPLARFIPMPVYHLTALALVLLALAGFALPVRTGWPLLGFGGAVILWLTAIAIGLGAGSRLPVPVQSLDNRQQGR